MERNILIIKELIQTYSINSLGIYSYAIWGDDNLNEFISNRKNKFEDIFNLKIDNIVTVPDMIEYSSKYSPSREKLSLHDYWKSFSKVHSFLDFTKHFTETSKDTEFHLVDDTVSSEVYEIKLQRTVYFHNV